MNSKKILFLEEPKVDGNFFESPGYKRIEELIEEHSSIFNENFKLLDDLRNDCPYPLYSRRVRNVPFPDLVRLDTSILQFLKMYENYVLS